MIFGHRNKTNVLAVTNENLLVIRVIGQKNPEVKKLDQIDLGSNSWVDAVQQAADQLKDKTCRVLLADELSYLTKLKLKMDRVEDRDLVKREIQAVAPEMLADNDWDYRVIGSKDDKKEIIAFAPLKKFFVKFSHAVKEAKLKVEAVEPIKIAKKRDSNPFIGLAQKKDINGPDAEVLNLIVANYHPRKNKNKRAKMPKKRFKQPKQILNQGGDSHKKSKLGLILISILVVFLLSAAGLMWLDSRSQDPKLPRYLPWMEGRLFYQQTEEELSAEEVEPDSKEDVEETATDSGQVEQATESGQTATDSAETDTAETELDLGQYQLEVLNGVGQAGLAGEVADTLQAQGFEEIDAGNADSFDYEETIVQHKPEINQAVLDEVEQALGNTYSLSFEDSLSAEAEYDLVIIIGQ